MEGTQVLLKVTYILHSSFQLEMLR